MYLRTETIITTIKDYPDLVKNLANRIENITIELLNLDDNLYRYTSYGNVSYGKVGVGSNSSDLSDIVNKKNSSEKDYAEELNNALYELKMKLANIRRIHLCYMVLPFKEHELLRRMYEEKMSWGKLSEEYQVSISTLSRQRTRALKMIQIAYSSDLSNSDILHLQKVQKKITWQNVIQKYTKKEEKKEM